MPDKLTQEQFIKKSQEIHGDKYDYSKVLYINSKTKVIIFCKKHEGYFNQMPASHYKHGCQKCARKDVGQKTKKSLLVFIEQAKEIHNNKYDYVKVDYKNTHTKVDIFCKKHEYYFKQTPNNHIVNLAGCPKCKGDRISNLKSKGADQFIKEAMLLYGEVDTYDAVKYKDTKTPIKINCKIHGQYEEYPERYLKGYRCKECNKKGNRCQDKEVFIKEAEKVHGDIHDYSDTKPIGFKKKIKVRCKKHDKDFELQMSCYFRGQGCPLCMKENYRNRLTKTTAEFIKEAIEKHGDLYDYDEVEYKLTNSKVKIKCKKHNHSFKILPSNHLNHGGCNFCTKERGTYILSSYLKEDYIKLAKGRVTSLYLIKCNNEKETFYKIGKTFLGVNKRFIKSNLPYAYEIISEIHGEAGFIWDLEIEQHRSFKDYKYFPEINFSGYTECYNLNLPVEKIINL